MSFDGSAKCLSHRTLSFPGYVLARTEAFCTAILMPENFILPSSITPSERTCPHSGMSVNWHSSWGAVPLAPALDGGFGFAPCSNSLMVRLDLPGTARAAHSGSDALQQRARRFIRQTYPGPVAPRMPRARCSAATRSARLRLGLSSASTSTTTERRLS